MPSLRSITGVVLASLVVVTIGAAPTRAGTATPAQKCLAAKHQAVGKKMACRLGCTAKAILKGLAVSDPTVVSCLSACGTTFSAAITKADQRGGCPTPGDAGSRRDAQVWSRRVHVCACDEGNIPTLRGP